MAEIIVQSMVVGDMMTNCYFIQNPKTREMLLVDPGEYASAICRKVSNMQGVVVAILLTHGHFDHIMALEAVRRQFGCDVYAEEHEKEVLADPEKNLTGYFGAPLSVRADHYLKDGEELSLAGFRIQVIYTPGHTIGGCCYYFPDEKILLSGDTLFAGSCGRVDFPTSSQTQMMDSLRRLLTDLPEDVSVYPGHNMATTIRDEREYNPYAPRS